MAYFRKRDNGWEYRISYKGPDGKYKQKSKSGFQTKKLAQIRTSRFMTLLKRGPRSTNDHT